MYYGGRSNIMINKSRGGMCKVESGLLCVVLPRGYAGMFVLSRSDVFFDIILRNC